MRHPGRSSLAALRPPAARLLVLALGLFGFVVAPAAPGVQGGTSPHGTIAGVRTGPAQTAPARPRAATKPRTPGRVQAVITAVALHAAGAAAPHAQPAHATLPASGIEVRPPSRRAAPPAAAPAAPDLAPRGVPRGRAPPAATRI
ncbi:hypothetical protein K8Z49_44045 [Actinomadura madurae]|uniref:Uncharacterized protein n=2 Tax=Actinomadura TaxID=1988 RepID=A0A1I4WNU5_9ACTN|nr:hypothetical protein [Actinomadura madurae]SFN14912.1 hypothetical protein SAMN04489713_101423 [Actinomadura madurae]